MDYSERVKRAVAPLTGPLHGQDGAVEAHDIVTAAKMAALVAALAALGFRNQKPISKYEQVPTPSQKAYIMSRLSD